MSGEAGTQRVLDSRVSKMAAACGYVGLHQPDTSFVGKLLTTHS